VSLDEKGTETMNDRIREMLSWYSSEKPGICTNLAHLLNHGRLGGTGKMAILPVDQGFEHDPARSFAPNPAGYNPGYFFQLAIEAGCNAYAAPPGSLEAGIAHYYGDIPLILKCSNHNLLHDEKDPLSVRTAGMNDALRLGCVAVGFTMYHGSAGRTTMYEEQRKLTAESRAAGLAVVVWSYPRGSGLSKEGETAIDVVAYAAHIAAQLRTNIIKVELAEAQKLYSAVGNSCIDAG
jgi:class I fructose-bisphosphate aldolase